MLRLGHLTSPRTNQWSVVPEMSFANRVDGRIWWLTVSKAADRSSKISVEDLKSALASLVAVEEVILCEKGRDLVEQRSFKCFCNERKRGNRSVVL